MNLEVKAVLELDTTWAGTFNSKREIKQWVERRLTSAQGFPTAFGFRATLKTLEVATIPGTSRRGRNKVKAGR